MPHFLSIGAWITQAKKGGSDTRTPISAGRKKSSESNETGSQTVLLLSLCVLHTAKGESLWSKHVNVGVWEGKKKRAAGCACLSWTKKGKGWLRDTEEGKGSSGGRNTLHNELGCNVCSIKEWAETNYKTQRMYFGLINHNHDTHQTTAFNSNSYRADDWLLNRLYILCFTSQFVRVKVTSRML